MRTSALAACALLFVGCPDAHTSPDVGSATDAPVLDAPAPGTDAPATLDAPVPATDTPAPIADAPSSATDAPVVPSDGPAPVCVGLAPAACLDAGCIAVWDDACCPTCTAGGCADCTNLGYERCDAPASSPCGTLDVCGVSAQWTCDASITPDCSTASVVDLDSCTEIGCVPSFPTGTGAPDVSTATCTPVLAVSCTVSCRRIAPDCPTGTTPEGDGFCYTDRCIPGFVCGR